jgi:predicted nuclease with TOPRIM domain
MTDAQALHIKALESRIERDDEVSERLVEVDAKLNEFGDHLDEIDGRLGLIEQSCARLAGHFDRMAAVFELLGGKVKSL